MSLHDKLTQDFKDAVKQRNRHRVSVIRMIRSQMNCWQIQPGTDFSSESEATILEKEAIAAYQPAGAVDRIAQEEAELPAMRKSVRGILDT